MHRIHLSLPVYLPDWCYRRLRQWRRQSSAATTKNLLGDRDIEWSWVAAQIPAGAGTALDFGPGGSSLGLIAVQRGYEVTAVDLGPVNWPYHDPRLRFVQGDILELPFEPAQFDLVINCSTVEHIGLTGRYGVTKARPDGDLEAMARLREIIKPGGSMLLTIPVGQDAVFAPLCRVYGAGRLPQLIKGFTIEREQYWVKDDRNRWIDSPKGAALQVAASAGSWDALRNYYGLGGLVLRRG